MDLTVEECSNLPRFLPLSPETQRKGRSLGGSICRYLCTGHAPSRG